MRLARRPIALAFAASSALLAPTFSWAQPGSPAPAATTPTPTTPLLPSPNDVGRPDGFLVAPFVNSTKVKQLDWMATALPVLLAEKLEEHPGLRPVYGPRVLEANDAFGTPEAEEKLAKRADVAGARYVLTGTFARPNWKSEITLQLWEVIDFEGKPTLKKLGESTSVKERNQLFEQLDDGLAQLVAEAHFQLDGETLARLRRRPTKDLYAFTLYGRGIGMALGIGGPKELDKAEKTLKKVNLIDPKFAAAHRYLGVVHLEQNQPKKALSQYAYALDLDPNYFSALRGLVRMYRLEGNAKRAQELAERALAVRPHDLVVRTILGELLWEAGQLDEAQVHLERVVEVEPRNVTARRTLALIYAAKGETANLAAELERVQQLAPDDVDVRLDLGSAYQRMGVFDRAIAAYEEVIKKQPKNAQAYKQLGDCFRARKDYDKAIAAYQKMLRLVPEDPRPYFLLGAAYVDGGYDTKAENVFGDALQFKRYTGEAWTNLGAIAYRRGDLAKANWYLSRAVSRVPNRPKAHYNYALVLSAKKERDRALDELRIAGDLDDNDPEPRYLSGVILLRLGRLDEARTRFEEALKRNPSHADAKHNLALLIDLEKRYGSERSGTGSK